MTSHTLNELMQHIPEAQLRGDPTLRITGVKAIARAQAGELSFLSSSKHRQYLAQSQASVIILTEADLAHWHKDAIVVANPQKAYACIAGFFRRAMPVEAGIHPSAIVAPSAQIDPSASIGAYCIISEECRIGVNCVLGPHCVLEAGVQLGADCRLAPRVTLCHDVVLGQRVLVHSGAVIGSEGFGFAPDRGRWYHVPQIGSVRIGDDCDIGANTTIDRGAIEDTVLEDGVKLDNLIQIAHNVHVGAHSAMAGCVGVAGSARIGRHCMIGGGVGISGHLTIADGTQVTGMSLVSRSIHHAGTYSSGMPVQENKRWNKTVAWLHKLSQLAERITQLEKRFRKTT